MNSHDEMLDRMRGANPLPDVDMITEGQLAEMTLQVDKARRAGADTDRPVELTPVRPRIRWWRPAAVFAAALLAAFVVIGAVSLVTGGESDVANEPTTATTVSASSTTVSASSTTVPLPPGEWNPILATTVAGIAPEPATCPAGADPDTPGSPGQTRPSPSARDDHDAAFDRRAGRIMHVDGEGETWAFDVCSNTWLNLNATGEPIDQSLVYDLDSDVTIAIGPGDFSVYDAPANIWTRPSVEVVGGPAPGGFAGIAYDPISGLVITTGENAIWAYDVDSDRLTLVGAMPEGAIGLGGYLPDIDRLVIGVAWSDSILVDPRTGEQSPAPDELPFLTRYGYHDNKGAAAVDMTNDRLVVIGSYATDDVVGIDLETSELIELLAATERPEAAAPEGWNQLLSTTQAAQPPQSATCLAGASPDTPGPPAQTGPVASSNDHDAAAFDRRTGRVMYLDTERRLWAFDVCTNTWSDLEPTGVPLGESLVYDVDSDITVAYGEGGLSIYDAAANQWVAAPIEYADSLASGWLHAGTYDPVSGLVIVQHRDQVWAFDAESNLLTLLGLVDGQLAGYVTSLDRLVFAEDFQTVLIDPRTGETTVPATGELPFAGWAWFEFFDAYGTVFIGSTVDGPNEGCGFNPTTLAWDLCLTQGSPPIETFASRVEDPINDRVVLIHYSRIQGQIIDSVWALDMQGQMIELLEPSE